MAQELKNPRYHAEFENLLQQLLEKPAAAWKMYEGYHDAKHYETQLGEYAITLCIDPKKGAVWINKKKGKALEIFSTRARLYDGTPLFDFYKEVDKNVNKFKKVSTCIYRGPSTINFYEKYPEARRFGIKGSATAIETYWADARVQDLFFYQDGEFLGGAHVDLTQSLKQSFEILKEPMPDDLAKLVVESLEKSGDLEKFFEAAGPGQ